MLLVIIIVMNNKLGVKRSFVVMSVKGTEACFLVDDAYKVTFNKDSIEYANGKNSGTLTVHHRPISSDFHATTINDLPAAYKKLKNKRIYEYEVAPNFIIKDVFVFVDKSSVNLVPYKETCEKIKLNFKQHREIF